MGGGSMTDEERSNDLMERCQVECGKQWPTSASLRVFCLALMGEVRRLQAVIDAKDALIESQGDGMAAEEFVSAVSRRIGMGKYVDLSDLADEDRRIARIGEAMMALPAGRMVAFITDDEPPEKVDRYVEKLLARYPELRVVDRFKGPAPGVVTVRITR